MVAGANVMGVMGRARIHREKLDQPLFHLGHPNNVHGADRRPDQRWLTCLDHNLMWLMS